jgi:hypothetical protein
MRFRLLLLTVALTPLVLACGQLESLAQTPEISIKNGFGYPLHIWIWPRERKAWVKPAPYLPKAGRINLKLATPGDYYLLARDSADNDAPIGFVDMHKVVNRVPGARLIIDGQYVFETRVETYTVTTLQPVTKTRTVRVWHNGRWEDREQSYTVYESVQEERQRKKTVSHPHLFLNVEHDGRTVSLTEFLEMTAP